MGYSMMYSMIKNAKVTSETPSVISGKKNTIDVNGESVTEEEEEPLETVEQLKKSAAFTKEKTKKASGDVSE